jgi:hypothetical protein
MGVLATIVAIGAAAAFAPIRSKPVELPASEVTERQLAGGVE